MHSTYRWLGKIERDDEVLVFIKTARQEMAGIEATIREISGYELPELLAVEISGGSADYLAWVAASIGENAVHGSDAPETAAVEIAWFFKGIDIH